MTTPKLTIELCNDIYQDFLLNPRDVDGNLRGHKSLLAALGCESWVAEFGSRAGTRTSWGFRRVAALVRKNLPEYLDLLYAVKSGTVKPLTNVPDKNTWLKPFLRAESDGKGNDIMWGLEDTKGRDDFFKSKKYKYFYLRIKNGNDIIDEYKTVPFKFDGVVRWQSVVDLDTLGGDDDYLLEYGYGKDGWFMNRPRMLGMTARAGVAKINGIWVLVDHDDIDENGEYMGDDTDPENVVTVEPPTKERLELNRKKKRRAAEQLMKKAQITLDETAEEEGHDTDPDNVVTIEPPSEERLELNKKKKEEYDREQLKEFREAAETAFRTRKEIPMGWEPDGNPTETRKKPDPAIVKRAWDYFTAKQNLNPEWGGDWYRCLLALGESPVWKGDTEPGEAFTLEDFIAKEARWSGWRRFRRAFEKMGGI